MIVEELYKRYGSHVARRVQQELSNAEFKEVSLAHLVRWLEKRAEAAHKAYLTRLENPLITEADELIKALYRRWQNAEELAYVIAIAEDVNQHAYAVARAAAR
ncbi:MAG: hypothetical protein AB7H77_02085 [Bdellovibrionales bacterium]